MLSWRSVISVYQGSSRAHAICWAVANVRANIISTICHVALITKNDSIYLQRSLSQWICRGCSQDIFPFNHCEEDYDFIGLFSGLWNAKPTNSFFKAGDKLGVFLRFELIISTNSPLYDVDSDLNLYCNFHNAYLPPRDYHSEDTFNSMFRKVCHCRLKIILIHSNLRSIPSNLNSIISYLENLSANFTIMAFTETWPKK